MTDSKHTPGPWDWQKNFGTIFATDGPGRIGMTNSIGKVFTSADGEGVRITREQAAANADRIVACVNGCDGLNPEAYREVVEALEGVVREYERPWGGPVIIDLDGISALIAKARGEA